MKFISLRSPRSLFIAVALAVGGCGDDSGADGEMASSDGGSTAATSNGPTTAPGDTNNTDTTTPPGADTTTADSTTADDSDGASDSDSTETGDTGGEELGCSLGPTERLTPDGVTAQTWRVKMDGLGTAVVAWFGREDADNRVFVNTYDLATQTWAGTEQLHSGGSFTMGFDLFIDGQGNRFVHWVQDDHIMAVRYDRALDSWTTTQTLHEGNFDVSSLNGAADLDGNAMITWIERSEVQQSVWMRRYEVATDTWGPAELLEDQDVEDARDVRIKMQPNGDAMVLWQQNHPVLPQSDLWLTRYDATGSVWTEPEMMAVQIQAHPHLHLPNDGNASLLWPDADMVYIRRYDAATGSWGEEETAAVGSMIVSAFDVDASGNAVFSGTRYLEGSFTSEPLAAYYDAEDQMWGELQPMTGPEGVSSTLVMFGAGIDGDGNAIALWEVDDRDNPGTGVWANCRDARDGQWLGAQPLDTSLGLPNYYQGQFAMSPDGTGVVTWVQRDEPFDSHLFASPLQ